VQQQLQVGTILENANKYEWQIKAAKSIKMHSVKTLLENTDKPPSGSLVVIPFANQEILDWLGTGYITLAYAENPRTSKIFNREVFTNPPKFQGSYIIGTPPWTKKNSAEEKAIFDRYGTDSLYKCFIKMLLKDFPLGGLLVLPLRFLIGTRESEQKRRREFFRTFRPQKMQVFSDLLRDNEVTLIIQFIRRTDPLTYSETVPVTIISSTRTLNSSWTIQNNEDPFVLESNPFHHNLKEAPKKTIKAHVDIYKTHTLFYLNKSDPISLSSTPLEQATHLCVKGFVSKKLRDRIIKDFNNTLKEWRYATESLFLPYVVIKDKKTSYIDIDLALIWIERLIWSYYQES